MQAKEIKTGAILNYNESPVIIETINVQSPSARGAATLYKFRARNVVTKQKVDITLKGSEGLPEADFERREIKLMYVDNEAMHLLDQVDYNQYSMPLEEITEETKYITENLEGMMAMIYNDQCVGIQLPASVELEVTQCDPAAKGEFGHVEIQAGNLGNRLGDTSP